MKGQKYFETSIKYFTGTNEKKKEGQEKEESILRKRFGEKLLSEIDYKTLEDSRDDRKATPTQYGTPRSERTVNFEMAILRHIFRKGHKWGMLDKTPFTDAEDLFYKIRNKRERALTEDEVKRLIDASPPYLKPIIFSAIHTGLRKRDILGLRWKDIDLEKGIICLVEAKTEKIRTIILNEDMRKLLHSMPVKGEYVFPGKEGKPFRDIKRSFEMALKLAGIKQSEDRRLKVVFHTLRHTCISLLTEKGVDTTSFKNYVDHASEEMTKQYTHLTEEHTKKTAGKLEVLYPIENVIRNKMETIEEKPTSLKNPSLVIA